MPRRVYNRFCPLSLALEDVGDRWTLHVVYALLSGPKRYADLKHYLDGAGSNLLGDRLRRLADAHVVGRSTGNRPGSETTYHLTERGWLWRQRSRRWRSGECRLSRCRVRRRMGSPTRRCSIRRRLCPIRA
jgi:DNA-binding HxlR family transcriptional regulator